MQRHWNGQTENHPTIEGSLLSTFSTGVRHAFDRASKLFVPYPSGLTDARGNAIPANRGWLYDSLSYQGFAPQFADGFSHFVNRNTFDHDLYRANLERGQKGTKPELPETLDFEYRKRPLDAQHVEGIVLPLGDTFRVHYHDAWGLGIHREITFGWQRFSDEVILDQDTGIDRSFRFEINTAGFDWFNGKDSGRARWDRKTTREFQGGFELQHLGSGKLSFIRPDFVELTNGSRAQIPIQLVGSLAGARGLVKLLPASVQAQAKYPIRIGTVDSFFSGAGDGRVAIFGAASWTLARDAATGGYASITENPFRVAANAGFACDRTFLPFDTSSLNDLANVSAGIFKLFEYSVISIEDVDSSSLVFVGPTTQASPTSLSTSDFDKCGSVNTPSEVASRKTLASLSVGAYNSITLTDLSVISLTGYTLLGVRNSRDVDNLSPTGNNLVWFNSVEVGNTSQEPILEVTYTLPGTLLWSNMSGGMQNLSGGMHG